MGKKRRVWWIVGGIAVSVALFVAAAFFVGDNSTDESIDRAVAQIVEEYEFEYQSLTPSTLYQPRQQVTIELFSRAPMDAETADKILGILRAMCPSCEESYTGYDQDLMLFNESGGDPWVEIHGFKPKEQVGSRVSAISFIPDSKGVVRLDGKADASIKIYRFASPSLWQRIKGLWPW